MLSLKVLKVCVSKMAISINLRKFSNLFLNTNFLLVNFDFEKKKLKKG